MSMHAYFRQITPRALAAWQRFPSEAFSRLLITTAEGFDLEGKLAAIADRPAKVRDAFRRQFESIISVIRVEDNRAWPHGREIALTELGLDATDFGPIDHLGEVWDILQFGLNCAAAGAVDSPLTLAVVGGDPKGEDVGYGPIRSFTVDVVAAVHSALTATDDAALRACIAECSDGDALYRFDDPDESADWAVEGLGQLRGIYAKAAKERHVLITWLT